MRDRVVTLIGSGATIAIVAVLSLSCTYKQDQGGGAPAGYDAESYEAPPGRQVYSDGLIGGGGAGGSPAAQEDASVGGSAGGLDAARVPDVGIDQSAPIDMTTGIGREAGDKSCDLLTQDCAKGEGCYPASGRALCQLIDLGLSEGVLCGGSGDCDRGLGCFDNTCRQFCDTSATSCPPNSGRCVPLAGFDRAGYCAP